MTAGAEFRRFAVREAERYGGGAPVFLRELLQNARDAGARRIDIETVRTDSVESVTVSDDGRGMSRRHAEKFLLTLYASSKRSVEGTAGRFGVGFWSILAFEPSEIRISSRAEGGAEGWELIFDADLETEGFRRCSRPHGTTIRLVRRARAKDLSGDVWSLVRRDARHLRRPGSDEPVAVVVNGRPATEPIEPGSPGLYFSRRGLRGAVTLASEPRVDVLAHGLRVRTAATVEDLLLRPGRERSSRHRIGHSGPAPRVVVDSDRLAVLMDRGDIAQDRELERVVRVVRAETERLWRREIDRLAPRPLPERVFRALKFPLAVAAIVAGSFGAWSGLRGGADDRAVIRTVSVSSPASRFVLEPFVDLADRYEGPVTGAVDGSGDFPAIRYAPAKERPFLAAFRVIGIDDDGRPIEAPGEPVPAEGPRDSGREGLDIEVRFESSGPFLRLPVPTGHGVVVDSVRVDGRPEKVFLSPAGEPMIRASSRPGITGRAAYRTVPVREEGARSSRWPRLPPGIAREAAGLRALPVGQRIAGAVTLIRRATETGKAGDGEGTGFLEQCFAVGGGDCDVVNTALAAVLAEIGLPVRLAVGWVGSEGRVLDGLHAWVEVDIGEGRWVPSDASKPTASIGGSTATTPLPTPSVRKRSKAPSRPRVRWVVTLIAAVTAAGMALWAVLALRTRRRFIAGRGRETGPLVESLLNESASRTVRGEAWKRPLVPTMGVTGMVSLEFVERAAGDGVLFVGKDVAGETGKSCERGTFIVDGATDAGRVVAAAFGAIDLDRWERLWKNSVRDALCDEIETGVAGRVRPVEVRLSPGIDTEVEVTPGICGKPIRCLIDPEGPTWKRLRDNRTIGPAERLFRAVDLLVGGMMPAPEEFVRLLSELAVEAVVERGGPR